MSLKDLSQSVLKTIEEKNITPTPKWEFVLKNYFMWGISILSLGVGSLGFAVIIHMIKSNDWDLYSEISGNLFQFILATMPYFWFIFLALFVWLAYYNFKHTKGAYKHKFTIIALITVLISMALGSIFYAAGLGQMMDKVFSDRLPFYERYLNHRSGIWQQPDKGFLSGEIVQIESSEKFYIRSFENNEWLVIYLPKDDRDPRVNNLLNIGAKIKIKGREIQPQVFEVEFIRPLFPGLDSDGKISPPAHFLPPF